MANVYVYSGAAGAGTGADWANAYVTLAAAAAAKAAGDVFYVAHNHAETQASAMTITFPGTEANPNYVYCVDQAGSVPPVSADLRTTATVSTTGNNAITESGSVFFYGIIFSSGSGANTVALNLQNASNKSQRFTSCALRLGGTSGGNIVFGSASFGGAYAVVENTTIQVASVNSMLQSNGHVEWRDTASAISGATIPTLLFSFNSSRGGNFVVEGVDLSALGSGKTLVQNNGGVEGATVILKDCKLGSSVTITQAPVNHGSQWTDLVRCDSGDTNYRTERYRYAGTQTVETTIVRTGGASDGTTPIAWKIITTANSNRAFPFGCVPIAIWNETVGSAITLTVEGIWGGGAVPTNANIWMDVEYLGTSGFPLGDFATNGPADQLAAGTNLTSSSETWGGSTTKFKMAVTITPQEKGPITVYVKAALASSTFYIDPKIAVS